MKIAFISLFLFAEIAVSGTWRDIDRYYQSPGAAARAPAISYLPGGRLIYSIYSSDPKAGNSGTWVTRMREFGTDTFQITDFYQLEPGRRAGALAVALGSAQEVFVAGAAEGADGKSNCIIRRSVDAGNTWSTFYEYRPIQGEASCYAIAVRFGKIVIAGQLTVHGESKWFTQMSSDNGSSWATLEEFNNGGKSGQARGVLITKQRRIFVVGYTSNKSALGDWTVRASDDWGVTWNTVDFIGGQKDLELYSEGIAEGANGEIFVSGFELSKDMATAGLLRRSSDGGDSWITTDHLSFPDSRYAMFQDVTVAPNGKVYTCFELRTSQDLLKSLIRESVDGGMTWSTIDEYSGPGNQGAFPWGIAVGPANQIAVTLAETETTPLHMKGSIVREYQP